MWSCQPLTPAERISIYTDEGSFGFVLIQFGEDRNMKIIQCGSTGIKPEQKNYSVYEGELIGISWAVDKCSRYLAGGKIFTIFTDHRALRCFENF